MKKKPAPHPNVVVKKSASSGFGLFAARDMKRGAKIIEYVGDMITDEEAEERLGMYLFNLPGKWTIDGSVRWNTARYANHSCKPNAIAYYVGNKRVFIYTRRALKKGEEITYNYGPDFFEGHILERGCKCGYCDGKGNVKKNR